jgi:beta-galactosidase
MFAGGTNFGFMGGANYAESYSPRPGTPKRYIPHTTSYDVDALVSEGGRPTKKYFLCRDVLDEFLGKEKRPHVYEAQLTQSINVRITETADLYENIDNLTETKDESIIPKTMELYNQNYGLINYTTTLDGFADNPYPLHPYRYLDRANLYVDDEWFATFLRDRGTTKAAEGVDIVNGLPMFCQTGSEHKIDVLVENIGRVNHRAPMNYERKGLDDCIHYAGVKLYHYVTRTLPLDDLSRIVWKSERHRVDHKPCFFKGTFDAKSGIDTYVSFEQFDHGYVWINGFNVGRYDGSGPQLTLYVPGHLLNDTNNEIIVLDVHPVGEHTEISLIDHEILEGDSVELS